MSKLTIIYLIRRQISTWHIWPFDLNYLSNRSFPAILRDRRFASHTNYSILESKKRTYRTRLTSLSQLATRSSRQLQTMEVAR